MRMRIGKEPRNKVSPHNPERTKIPLAQKVHLLPTKNKLSSQRGDQHTSIALDKREKPLSLSGRETTIDALPNQLKRSFYLFIYFILELGIIPFFFFFAEWVSFHLNAFFSDL